MAAGAFNKHGVKEDYDPFSEDDDKKDWGADDGGALTSIKQVPTHLATSHALLL